MSNKATCPACGSHTSGVWEALNGYADECPYCGLSSTAMVEFISAQQRGADEDLLERAAKAEARADKAEARIRDLESRLLEIKWITTRDSDD